MAVLDELLVRLAVDSAQMRTGLNEAKAQASSFGSAMKDVGKQVSQALTFSAMKQAGRAVKELAEFVFDGAKAAAASGDVAAKGFLANVEKIEGAFKGVAAQAASQLAPALEKITSRFTESKTAAAALKDAGNFVANVFRVLASVGTVVVGIFTGIGQSIGAVASMIVDALSGNFEAATDTWRENAEEIKKIAGEVKATLGDIWTDGNDYKGPKLGGKQPSAKDAAAEQRRLAKAAEDAAKSVAKLSEETEGWDPTADWAQFSQEYQEQLSAAPLVQASDELFDFMATTQAVEGAMNSLAGSVLQAVPRLNQLVAAAQQGAQAGGVWGAIIAVFVQLISETEGFQRIIEVVNGDLDQLIDALEPLADGFADLMEAFDPISNLLTDVVGNSLRTLGAILQMVAPLLGALLKPLESILGLFKDITLGLSDFFESLKNFFAGKGFKPDRELQPAAADPAAEAKAAWEKSASGAALLAQIAAAEAAVKEAEAQSLDSYRYNMTPEEHAALYQAEQDARDKLHALQEQAMRDEAGFVNDFMKDLGDSSKDASKALDKLTGSLTNAPEGFKVALRRYDASNPMQDWHDTGGGAGGALHISVNVEGNVLAEQDLVAVVRDALVHGSWLRTGSRFVRQTS